MPRRARSSSRSSNSNWFGVSQSTMIYLTFVGMVGLYVGAAYAYKQYQEQKAQLQNSGAGRLLSLFGTDQTGSGGN